DYWSGKAVLKLLVDGYGDLSALRNRFTLGNFILHGGGNGDSTMPITPDYKIGPDGKLYQEAISDIITYRSVSGGAWVLQNDGRYQSPINRS
ncbi:MAG: hypothetical protein LBI91_04240, partial [Spirochaetaceae bacterium]|nr:hypothetical protein [Spirochaetaceae bacterium]